MRSQVNINIIINHHCRSFITTTNAIGQLEGEFTIGCGLTKFNPDFSFHAFNYGVVVLEKAGQALANPDYISALWLGGEKGIKGGYPIHIAYRETK